MDLRKMEQHICSEAWTCDEVYDNHRELCLTYRGRFSGSSNAAGAAEHIEKTLKRYGLENSRREFFDMMTWSRGTASLTLTGPVTVDFPCIALPYSPDCDLTLPLVDARQGHPGDLEAISGGVSGKAVLIEDTNPAAGPHYHRLHKYLFARQAGAAAFIFAPASPGMLAPTGSLAFNHNDPGHQALPSIGIPFEVASELRWRSERNPVAIRIRMENTLSRGRDCNVVAELNNTENGQETIIICGHYDGHDIAQGAVDNASGTAVVMETARILAPLKAFLPCSLRFVLFGSEEMGLLGSHAMAGNLPDSPLTIRFLFNLDCVGQPTHLALALQNCPELIPFFTTQVRDFPSDIEINSHPVPFSDHFPFAMRGVPAAFIYTPGGGGRGWGHTIADTFEKVSRETLMKMSMQMARMVLRTALAPAWPATRKEPDQIRAILEGAHMSDLLKFEDHWIF